MDVIITTNSPGEVSAWVRPMVRTLKKFWPDCKITVFIPPCTFASGQEVSVVAGFSEVDQVFGPKAYLRYVISHQKPRNFYPGQEGLVLFLGGDLGHAVLLGKRLKYPVYAYSERAAGHASSIRLFFVPTKKVTERLARKGIPLDKLRLVGDLMLDAIRPDISAERLRECLHLTRGDFVLNIFPGSRPHEVVASLPLFLKSALLILENKKISPLITLAPYVSLQKIEDILRRAQEFGWELDETSEPDLFSLKINDYQMWIYRGISYNTMQISDLVFSLPGTNNVELAAMEVPTLVILPLNWPELIPLPGLIGWITKIPLFGSWLKKKYIIPRLLPKFHFVSPVNRSRRKSILPEMIGMLTPEIIAERALEIMENELAVIREKLKGLRTDELVSQKIVQGIEAEMQIREKN